MSQIRACHLFPSRLPWSWLVFALQACAVWDGCVVAEFFPKLDDAVCIYLAAPQLLVFERLGAMMKGWFATKISPPTPSSTTTISQPDSFHLTQRNLLLC